MTLLTTQHSLEIVSGNTACSLGGDIQKFSARHPIIRTNATELYVYRLRNYKDLETFIEELSALYDKKTLLKLYEHATQAPYSFLYVKLTAKTKEDMFFMN